MTTKAVSEHSPSAGAVKATKRLRDGGWTRKLALSEQVSVAEIIDRETHAGELIAFVEKYVRETNCICKLNKIMAQIGVTTPCTNCEARALVSKAKEKS